LVNGRTPGQLGSYSLRTSFSAEAGVLCTAFPSAGLNQTMTGSLGAAGCRMLDASPYDGYRLRSFSAGTLTVSATADGFTPQIIVRSSDGAALASAASRVAVPVDGDARYVIVVHAAEGSGRYQMVTSFEPSEEETCRWARAITETGAGSGSVTSASCTTIFTQPGDPNYYDSYPLTLA